ncbi:PhpK family radical SAM P-methyltransferase [[Clostridium] polysaccharolyticum]|uniref:Radical SAM P-methyltransferase, PhpK family n=1 Tax=[Clostridium] polysaccharolyticum TaxID=29364 RepID=A0A1I0C4H3_9FIRM|nr:PhpK family radical SAM P-methyltransferase [[Clostridium] polysaccharolyticum]SET14181.1 radical SAM P-methyltransferase, PhpK family [[Clostridium] polysaccharolyticum]
MDVAGIIIGFNDEKMETIIKRIEPYKTKGASYEHMISRSALVDGKRLKYSELVTESITRSLGMKSDLSIYRMPNMAVHYICNYFQNRNVIIEPINNYNFGKERLRYLLQNSTPKFVAVSSTCIVEAAPLREEIEYIRSINPDVTVIVGGPFINSINYEYHDEQQKYLLQRIGADIFIHERQGEETLYRVYLELCKEKPDLASVPNILYREGNEIRRTVKQAENLSLDMDPVKKFTFYENHILPPVYVRTAISCSLHCAFCRYPILGGELMYMQLESIEKNFDYIHSIGVKYITFIDDSLNIPLERFKAIMRLMIRKQYNFRWCSFFRISHSDEETYELMEQSGCLGVILGIESGSNTILKNMDKRVTREKLFWGIQQLTKHHIISYASCVIGFPGETKETAAETIRFIREAKPTFYDLQCWFFENAVPINDEKKYYNLEGYGYSWSHKDMNSAEAGKIVTEAIRSIDETYFMPALSFNLWSLAYYISQGATIKEFFEFSNIFKNLISTEQDQVNEFYQQNVDKLMQVFRNNKALEANLRMRNSSKQDV